MKLPGFLQRLVARFDRLTDRRSLSAVEGTPEQQAAEQKRMQECGERIAAVLAEYGYDLAAVAQIQIVPKAKK